MDVTGVGAVAGGVAQPKTLVAGIARGSGIVGGKKSPARGWCRRASRLELNGSEPRLPRRRRIINLVLKSFFNLHLYILGVDLMECVVEVAEAALSDAAPKLIETISYGVSQADKMH